ncbi:hypothetical protein Pmar_PMAR002295 [Perkinsus marinus ATCC 50983]|uniref:Uncharacterized protein n=1 Tax=Perkinsus marinus (strain ATCC 50983 / TXsc) TaxID=423536 RepID=C5KUX7_PERM5|nr:hypothetical protein Pmar_PMAR002295 [Perkinsus marinus ATCC 50983]EER11692.1 hypothetical protein Pmar_PMAR002295 [Perkinsus marinus ATCC 50983]|eukprot:XP_002779897.1 hypothetical protein Pmar_PMAR002295 [Perkinsus marinus ATCC 50983]
MISSMILRELAILLALLGITIQQGCGSKSEASTAKSSGNTQKAGSFRRSDSSNESYRHQKTWSVYHPGVTTHRQVCTAKYNDTLNLKEYNLKLERRKEGSEKWTAKLSGKCGHRENLEADLTGDDLDKLQGEKNCVVAWEALGVTSRVIVARKSVPPVAKHFMDLFSLLHLLLATSIVFIGTIEIQGCGSNKSSTRGGAEASSTETSTETESAAKASKQTAPDEVKDGGKFKICRASSTDHTYKLSVQRTLKSGETQWKVKLVGDKCGDKTGAKKEIVDDLAKDLQGEDVDCKAVWEKFGVTAENPSRLKTLCTDPAWLALKVVGRKRKYKVKNQMRAPKPEWPVQVHHPARPGRVPGTPGDTVQSCDASAGLFHLIVKRVKRGGQSNYEVSMVGSKCGPDVVPETPLSGENTAKLQEDNISCAKVWKALGVATATSTEETLSDMCAKLKAGQL